jgi:hypothetical protein
VTQLPAGGKAASGGGEGARPHLGLAKGDSCMCALEHTLPHLMPSGPPRGQSQRSRAPDGTVHRVTFLREGRR